MTDPDWLRISALLDELFELDATTCERRLMEIAKDDAALAIRLRRLLAADASQGLLDAGVAAVAPTVLERLSMNDASPFDTAPHRAAPRGRKLGPYRLVERIGRGGMGEVWRGERIDDFEQVVAIKLIRPLMDSPALRERFSRERRILARLEHPNISRLLDGGLDEDGTPWYAMEFVNGEDIVAYARRHRLGARARVALLLQACDAVSRAQALLVVHRDIKPSNLLVDDDGHLRVLDFGIARLLDDSADARLTGTGVRVFSAAYAAPEQIRGDDAGTAADVFGLGAVLFELLVGAPPHPQRSAAPDRLFAGLDEESAPRPAAVVRNKAKEDGDPQLASLARELDGDLDLIVATTLHPDPARRYGGAAQLGEDLRRWLAGRPIAARADSASYRMRRFAARHRLAVGSASAVLLALVGGLGLALWQMGVAREEARRADAEAHRMQRTYRFVMSVFANIQTPIGGGANSQQSVEILLRDGLARIDTEMADMPDIRAGLRATWAESLIQLGYLQEALPAMERAVAELQSLTPPPTDDLINAMINLAKDYRDMARLAEAEATARRAMTLLEAQSGDYRKERVQIRMILANIAATQHRSAEAIALNEQILKDRRELPGIRPIELAANYNNLASAYLIADRYAEAEQRYRDLDQLLRDSPDSPPSRRVYALSGIAWSLLNQGRSDEALVVADEAQALGRETLSAEHDMVIYLQALRARAALANGDFVKADTLFGEALPRLNPLNAAMANLFWGNGLLEQGRVSEALPRLQAAVDNFRASERSDSLPGRMADTLLAIALAERDPAQTPAAQRELARFAADGLEQSDEYIRSVLAFADLQDRQALPAAARQQRQHAAVVSSELLGANHPLTLRAQAASAVR